MSDGWDGAGARHDQPSDDEPADTTLHETLIEAYRVVRQGTKTIGFKPATIACGLW